MSSNEWEFDPTFVTPDGEPVTVEATDNPEYRQPAVLRRRHHEEGLSVPEIAEEYDVGVNTVIRHMTKHGIEMDYEGVWEIRNPSALVGNKPGPKPAQGTDPLEAIDDPGPFTCPECGSEYDTRAEESECAAQDVRDVADRGEVFA